MLANGFLLTFCCHANQNHFGSDKIFKKFQRFFEQELSFFLIVLFVGFEFNFFHCDTQQNNNFIEVAIIPLELFIVSLENVCYFLMGSIVFFAVLGNLLLREPVIFETGRMWNERSDWGEMFRRTGHCNDFEMPYMVRGDLLFSQSLIWLIIKICTLYFNELAHLYIWLSLHLNFINSLFNFLFAIFAL